MDKAVKAWLTKHFYWTKRPTGLNRLGIVFIRRPGDYWYMDIYLWQRMLMVTFLKAK